MNTENKTIKVDKNITVHTSASGGISLCGIYIPYWLLIVIVLIIILLIADYCKWINLGIFNKNGLINLPDSLKSETLADIPPLYEPTAVTDS